VSYVPSALFDFFDKPPAYKLAARRIADFLRRNAGRFSFAVIISAAAHVAFCGVLLISSAIKSKTPPGLAPSDDLQAFRQALRELSASPGSPAEMAKILSTITEDDFNDALRDTPELDSRLTAQEKAKIFKSVVSEALTKLGERKGDRSALDVPLSGLLGGLRNGQRSEPVAGFKLFRVDESAEGGSRLYRLSQEKEQTLASLLTRKGEPVAWTVISGRVILLHQKGTDIIPEEYFFRTPPYEAMLAVGARLFYVVRGFPKIEMLEGEKVQASEVNAANLTAPPESEGAAAGRQTQSGSLTIFFPRSSPTTAISLKSTEPVSLKLTEETRESILDQFMGLPERDQVRAFFRDYLDKYDPDSPDLARLTREFIYRNLGAVLILTDPLSAGFDCLEESFYNKLSMEDFTSFCLKNPRTKTGAEILFYLACSYDFERRAIRHLQEALETARAVLAGWRGDLAVYDKKAKAFVVEEIERELRGELKGLGLSKFDAVRARYAQEQIKIYRFLADLGGDIRNRALYALGEVYWDEGRPDLALNTWRSVDPAYSFGPLDDMRRIMSDTEDTVKLVSRISGALSREADFDSSEQFRRLLKFHKWARRAAGGE
jgi:hypothetical protein